MSVERTDRIKAHIMVRIYEFKLGLDDWHLTEVGGNDLRELNQCKILKLCCEGNRSHSMKLPFYFMYLYVRVKDTYCGIILSEKCVNNTSAIFIASEISHTFVKQKTTYHERGGSGVISFNALPQGFGIFLEQLRYIIKQNMTLSTACFASPLP